MLPKLLIGYDTDFLLKQSLSEWAGKPVGRENNPDVVVLPEEVEGVSSIGVGDVRTLIKSLQLKPVSGKTTLAVIQAAQLLTVEAQNSLLKLLEEPPDHVQLILICSQPEVLLPTVLSRVVVIADQKSNIKNQKLDSQAEDKLIELVGMNPVVRLAKTAELAKTREAALELVKVWLRVGHGWLVGKKNVSAVETPRSDIGASLRTADLVQMLKSLQQAMKYLEANTHAQLTMDWLLLRLPKI